MTEMIAVSSSPVKGHADKDSTSDEEGGESENRKPLNISNTNTNDNTYVFSNNNNNHSTHYHQLHQGVFDHYSGILSEYFRNLALFIRGKFIISPYSPNKQLWDLYIVCTILYNCLAIPYFAAFNPVLASQLIEIDIITTTSMIIDILIHFRTAVVDSQGELNHDPIHIAKRYTSSFVFKIDVFSSFPYFVFNQLSFVSASALALICLKLPSVLRYHRLIMHPLLNKYFQTPLKRIFRFMIMLLVLIHVFCCFFYFIATQESANTVRWVDVYDEMVHSLDTYAEQYIVSFYWSSSTMTVTGYGDVIPVTSLERVYVIILLLAVIVIFASILGQIRYSVLSVTQTQVRYQKISDNLNEYMTVNEMPIKLRQKLELYKEANWTQTKGFDSDSILNSLPNSVKARVMMHINHHLIQSVPFFLQCSDRFLEAIILKLKLEICLTGDYVFKEGDKSREMYFIHQGIVSICLNDDNTGEEMIVATIDDNHQYPFFGEISLLIGETRTASVRAESKCLFAALRADDFFEVLSMFPDEEHALRETAQFRLSKDVERAENREKEKQNRNSIRAIGRMNTLRRGSIKAGSTINLIPKNEKIRIEHTTIEPSTTANKENIVPPAISSDITHIKEEEAKQNVLVGNTAQQTVTISGSDENLPEGRPEFANRVSSLYYGEPMAITIDTVQRKSSMLNPSRAVRTADKTIEPAPKTITLISNHDSLDPDVSYYESKRDNRRSSRKATVEGILAKLANNELCRPTTPIINSNTAAVQNFNKYSGGARILSPSVSKSNLHKSNNTLDSEYIPQLLNAGSRNNSVSKISSRNSRNKEHSKSKQLLMMRLQSNSTRDLLAQQFLDGEDEVNEPETKDNIRSAIGNSNVPSGNVSAQLSRQGSKSKSDLIKQLKSTGTRELLQTCITNDNSREGSRETSRMHTPRISHTEQPQNHSYANNSYASDANLNINSIAGGTLAGSISRVTTRHLNQLADALANNTPLPEEKHVQAFNNDNSINVINLKTHSNIYSPNSKINTATPSPTVSTPTSPKSSSHTLSPQLLSSNKISNTAPKRKAHLHLTGTLYIELLSAHNLVAADRGGTSDPTVELSLISNQSTVSKKSKTIKKTLNPEWIDEKFEFSIYDFGADQLKISMFDWDLFGNNDFLGDYTIKLRTLQREFSNGKFTKEFNLQNTAHGSLKLTLEFKTSTGKYLAPTESSNSLNPNIITSGMHKSSGSKGSRDLSGPISLSNNNTFHPKNTSYYNTNSFGISSIKAVDISGNRSKIGNTNPRLKSNNNSNNNINQSNLIPKDANYNSNSSDSFGVSPSNSRPTSGRGAKVTTSNISSARLTVENDLQALRKLRDDKLSNNSGTGSPQ